MPRQHIFSHMFAVFEVIKHSFQSLKYAHCNDFHKQPNDTLVTVTEYLCTDLNTHSDLVSEYLVSE